MRADNDERIRRSDDRRDEELARRVEASGSQPAAAVELPPPEAALGAGAEPASASSQFIDPALLPQSAAPEPAGEGAAAAGPSGEMQVEDDEDGGLMDSLLAEARVPSPSRRLVREATRLYEFLLITGVSPGDARAKIVELYSPPRVTSEAATLPGLSLAGGSTFDLRADANGRSWDFRLESDRRKARAQIAREKPFLVIGSPPCTAFSILQALNKKRVTGAVRARQLAEAQVLLGFAIEIYEMQLRAGRHFLHEHPASASSWGDPRVARLLRDPRVGVVTGDQCRYGLQARCEGGGQAPARKPTRFMSSSPAILERLSLRCRGAHRHQTLLGGRRASAAAIYPPGLCRAVLLGAEDQYRLDGGTVPSAVLEAVDAGTGVYDLTLDDEESGSPRALAAVASEEVSLDPAVTDPAIENEDVELERFDDGRWQQVDPASRRPQPAGPAEHADAAAQLFHDELTGKPLPAAAVQASRREEVEFMEGWNCWERVSEEEARRLGGKRPLKTRWVDVNKGDEAKPDIRCRLVAKDIAYRRDDSFYAATPPRLRRFECFSPIWPLAGARVRTRPSSWS